MLYDPRWDWQDKPERQKRLRDYLESWIIPTLISSLVVAATTGLLWVLVLPVGLALTCLCDLILEYYTE